MSASFEFKENCVHVSGLFADMEEGSMLKDQCREFTKDFILMAVETAKKEGYVTEDLDSFDCFTFDEAYEMIESLCDAETHGDDNQDFNGHILAEYGLNRAFKEFKSCRLNFLAQIEENLEEALVVFLIYQRTLKKDSYRELIQQIGEATAESGRDLQWINIRLG